MEVSLGRTTLALVSGSQRQQPREQVPGPLRDTRAARRGLWKPPLPAQGWQSPSGPLPVDKVSESGLGPTSPRVQWNPGPGMPTAHLLILGPPVQMGFSVHVQQQQVTEEGDLGEAGRPVSWPSACPPTTTSPAPQPKTQNQTQGSNAHSGTRLPLPTGARVGQTHHAQPGCSCAQGDSGGDEPELPCLRETWAEPLGPCLSPQPPALPGLAPPTRPVTRMSKRIP